MIICIVVIHTPPYLPYPAIKQQRELNSSVLINPQSTGANKVEELRELRVDLFRSSLSPSTPEVDSERNRTQDAATPPAATETMPKE